MIKLSSKALQARMTHIGQSLGKWLRVGSQLHKPADTTAPNRVQQAIQRIPPRYRWAIGIATGGTLVTVIGLWWIDRTLPNAQEVLTFQRTGTITIKAADNAVLQQLGPATHEKTPLAKIPQPLMQAFIASEDRRFYQHDGLDWQGIARATARNIRSLRLVEGGSTITQQLARIVFLNQERTAWRKFREMMLAQKIDRQLDKTTILEQYLNLVYLGSGAYGVADAAWVYFSKPVAQLTLAEAAMIAGLAPAPSVYSPLVNPDLALKRRNLVLDRMQEAGYIDAKTVVSTKATPLATKPSLPKRLHTDAPYFTTYVMKELPKLIPAEAVEVGGLTIETTLNLKWQQVAEKAIKEAVEYDGPASGFNQASLIAVDPKTGEIRAMVGGYNFKKSQFNRATQAQRQPGSTFKTFVYATAIATGRSPYDGYLDAPFVIDGYEPQNYSRRYSGWMSIRDAITNSVNVIAVKTLVDTGFDPVIHLTQQLGIHSPLKSTYSMALGAFEVNLLELTSAYGTLAAQGEHVEPHGIVLVRDRYGKVLYSASFKPKRVLDKDSAAIMTWMLRDVIDYGTGQPAQLGREAAGKTGTSENYRDLWFVGYIPQLVAGIWLGNDNNSPTYGSSGTAAYTWHQFMNRVVQGMPVQQFPPLPRLEGRKGTIKAKPIKPKRVYEPAPPAESTYDNTNNYDNNYNSNYDRPSEGYSSSNSGSYSGRSSEQSNPAPQAPAVSAPVSREAEDLAEPAPAEPSAAPSEPAAPEPAPIEVPSAPVQSAPTPGSSKFESLQ